VTSGPQELSITIADTGQGIPDDHLERVLEPFYRMEESRNRETGGTGLGLAITKAIAESHGGKLMLSNGVSGGVAATITIPRG
jgi:protein-histidine pros-kinase